MRHQSRNGIVTKVQKRLRAEECPVYSAKSIFFPVRGANDARNPVAVIHWPAAGRLH